MLNLSWPKFLGLVVISFLALNCLFAGAYLACGPSAIQGVSASDMGSTEFLRAFFFSVETFATIGYDVSPVGLAANLVVTVESLVGLLGFALATGILFARFSRPTAKIVFSEKALIAPYRRHGVQVPHRQLAQQPALIEVECKVLFSPLPQPRRRAPLLRHSPSRP